MLHDLKQQRAPTGFNDRSGHDARGEGWGTRGEPSRPDPAAAAERARRRAHQHYDAAAGPRRALPQASGNDLADQIEALRVQHAVPDTPPRPGVGERTASRARALEAVARGTAAASVPPAGEEQTSAAPYRRPAPAAAPPPRARPSPDCDAAFYRRPDARSAPPAAQTRTAQPQRASGDAELADLLRSELRRLPSRDELSALKQDITVLGADCRRLAQNSDLARLEQILSHMLRRIVSLEDQTGLNARLLTLLARVEDHNRADPDRLIAARNDVEAGAERARRPRLEASQPAGVTTQPAALADPSHPPRRTPAAPPPARARREADGGAAGAPEDRPAGHSRLPARLWPEG